MQILFHSFLLLFKADPHLLTSPIIPYFYTTSLMWFESPVRTCCQIYFFPSFLPSVVRGWLIASISLRNANGCSGMQTLGELVVTLIVGLEAYYCVKEEKQTTYGRGRRIKEKRLRMHRGGQAIVIHSSQSCYFLFRGLLWPWALFLCIALHRWMAFLPWYGILNLFVNLSAFKIKIYTMSVPGLLNKAF